MSVKKESTLLEDLNQALAGETLAFLPYYEPPRRGNDLKALIKDSLKLERASIDFFTKLALKTRDSDLITYRMAMDVMAEEARDEQRISALVE